MGMPPLRILASEARIKTRLVVFATLKKVANDGQLVVYKYAGFFVIGRLLEGQKRS